MKARLLLLMLPILFLVTACSKSTVNPNQTILVTIPASKWSTSDGGRTYAAFINMPEIDTYANAYDAILAYASFDNSTTYEQMPEVFNGVSYSFTHKTGQIEVDLQAANGTNVITPPASSVNIKVVIISSSL